MLRILTTAICLVMPTIAALSQSNTLTSGGDASSTSGSIGYSIGQIDYLNSAGTSGSFNQGLQQPYEIMEVNDLAEGVKIDLSIGPNPTSDELTIISTSLLDNTFTFSIFDAKGSIILGQQPLHNSQKIKLAALASGEYFLDISSNSQRVKTYKIIKN